MPRWLIWLHELLTRERRERDLDRELEAHLQAEVDDQIEAGVASEEAVYAARRALGNVRLTKEDTRAMWDFTRLETWSRGFAHGLRQDVVYGLRSLRKQPAFTAAAVLALALGIGAATTIASVIQNVLLDPYPMYFEVDRIVNVQVWDLTARTPSWRGHLQAGEFLEYQGQSRSFVEVIGGSTGDVLHTTAEGSERFHGGLTTGNTFSFMGVPAVLGRTLTLDDAKPGAPAVFVMSHRLWLGRFGGDPTILGRSFTLNDVPTTLIGIMPPRVGKLGAELWRPVRLDPADPENGTRFFMFQGRLKPGVTMPDAEAELNVIAQRVAKLYPKLYPPKFQIRVVGLVDSVVGPFRRTLSTMAGAVAMLLLIACANVAEHAAEPSRRAPRRRSRSVRRSARARCAW